MNFIIRLARLAALLPFYIKEVVFANARVAHAIILPRHSLAPVLIRVDLEPGITDLQLLVLSNLITMTPGTLTLEVDDARSHLYVHAMLGGDDLEKIRSDLKDYERRVRHVF